MCPDAEGGIKIDMLRPVKLYGEPAVFSVDILDIREYNKDRNLDYREWRDKGCLRMREERGNAADEISDIDGADVLYIALS